MLTKTKFKLLQAFFSSLRPGPWRVTMLAQVAVILGNVTLTAAALEFESPDVYREKNSWTGQDLGLPDGLGNGLFFHDQGDVLYVVGHDDALYSLDVIRDAKTGEIDSFTSPTFVFAGDGGLSAGWAKGPEETLFYSYGAAELLAQRAGGVQGEERVFDLFSTGLRYPSAAGVAFSPYMTDPNTGFGMLQLSDWSIFEHRVWNVRLHPVGDGYFEPQEAQILATFPGATGFEGTTPSVAGDIEYIPSGPQAGNLLVADWNGGKINILTMDQATGWPIDRTTGVPTLGTTDPELVPFASVEKPWSSGRGPWSMTFDPITNNLFVLMDELPVSNQNTIVQVSGFSRSGVVLGDFNGNLMLDVADLDLLAKAQRDEGPLQPFDLNSDGRIDLDDRLLWIRDPDLGNTFVGDANLDGEFNSGDLVHVFSAGEYEDDVQLNSTWSTGDWDGDGDFLSADIVLAFTDGGYELGKRAVVQAVPEPSGAVLGISGLMMITLTVCLRRRASR